MVCSRAWISKEYCSPVCITEIWMLARKLQLCKTGFVVPWDQEHKGEDLSQIRNILNEEQVRTLHFPLHCLTATLDFTGHTNSSFKQLTALLAYQTHIFKHLFLWHVMQSFSNFYTVLSPVHGKRDYSIETPSNIFITTVWVLFSTYAPFQNRAAWSRLILISTMKTVIFL